MLTVLMVTERLGREEVREVVRAEHDQRRRRARRHQRALAALAEPSAARDARRQPERAQPTRERHRDLVENTIVGPRTGMDGDRYSE